METVLDYSVEFLKVHPRNSEFYDDISGEDYEQFKATIQNEGVLTPLIVAPDMTVISGHQRLKASKDLGLSTIPVIIRQDIKTEEEKMAVLLATNYGRPDSAKKKRKIADEYTRLRGLKNGQKLSDNRKALTQKQIAKELGISVSTLNEMLDIERKLTPEFKEMLDTGVFTETTASKILVKLSPEIQEKLVTTYGKEIIEGVTQKQMQEYVDKIKALEEVKAKEIENVKAGYEKKLEAAKKESDNSETIQLMEEKEELQTKLRKQYEQSQQLKKQLDEAKKKGSELPEDYEQIKQSYKESQRRIGELEINLKNERMTNEIKKDTPKSQFPIYDFEYFNTMCASFLQHVGYYTFKEDELGALNVDEAKVYFECIGKVEECLESIKSLINKNKKEIA